MKKSGKPKIIAVIGPTSSGKSDLAVTLALRFNGEVISADSRQVYKGLDIGTGKITRKEMRGVPHHLLDIVNYREQFSVADFVRLGKVAIENILARGKLPIVAGGTGHYIEALLEGVSIPQVPPNENLRKKLEQKSTQSLLLELKKLDLRRAREIDPANPRRLIRAIEIAKALGKVPKRKKLRKYDVLYIGLFPPERILRQKIKERIRARMRNGMVVEAKRLHAKGLSFKRMRELGLEYRLLADLLQKRLGKEEFIETLEKEIWHYVKRQKTYWRDVSYIPNASKKLQRALIGFLN